MLESWYNSASKNRLLFTFRPAFIIFAESGLSGQEMLPDFASRMLKIRITKMLYRLTYLLQLLIYKGLYIISRYGYRKDESTASSPS